MASAVDSRSSKTVFLLVGAKGSGKTYIGSLVEKCMGVHFLRVEQRLIDRLESAPLGSRQPLRDGYDLELKWIDDALLTRNQIISEATGSSRHLPQFLEKLDEKYDLKLVRISCPLDICFDRVRGRPEEHHFEVSDEKLGEINVASHNVELDWDLEIDNAGPASDEQILRAFDALRATKSA